MNLTPAHPRPRQALARIIAGIFSAAAAGVAAEAQTNLAVKWLAAIGQSDSSPAIGSDGTIYVGTFAGRFWALGPDGSRRWSFKTDREIQSSPAVGSDGTIYFGGRDGKFYALSPQGKKKWEFPTGAWVDSSPALGRDGTIYFGSWDKQFYALNPNGSVRWKFQTGGEIDSSPAVGADEAIYFGSHDRKLYALAREGGKRWEFPTGGPIISSPALDVDGTIYFTSVDGFLYALNPDGSLRWRLHTGGITESSPVIGSDGEIFLGVNQRLWGISSDGKKEWDREFINYLEASPTALEDNGVCAVSRQGQLQIIDEKRQPRWSFGESSSLYGRASPTIGADGVLFAQFQNSILYALETKLSLAKSPWPKFRGNSRNTGNINDMKR